MALEDYRNDMMRCVRCSVCKFIPLSSLFKSWRFSYGCPATTYYKYHTYSGGGKLIAALALIDGRIEYDEKLAEIVYKCTLCGMCDTSCKVGTDMEPIEILRELRIRMFEKGLAPLDVHKGVLDSMKEYDNVWMQPRSRRNNWAKKIEGLKDLNKEKADVLYFVGCTYAYDADLRRVAQKTANLLKNAGLDMGILGETEKCCASPAYHLGDEKTFQNFANQNIDQINDLGVSTVVTSCAGCFGLMKSHYPRLEGKKMNFKVMHSSEMIMKLIEEGKISPKNKQDITVTYHDPCHLGRQSDLRTPSLGKEEVHLGSLPVKKVPKTMGFGGVYDAPREVIKSIPGVKFVEMERRREYSWCCGSGGGAKSAFPDFAIWSATERVEEAHSVGAEAVLSACPWCEKNISDGVANKGSNMQVFDIIDLLTEATK